MNPSALGLSGRIAKAFQDNALTPLLALVLLLLGLFAIVVTPREEEPQIDVTMANVIVALPGASAADVEQMLAIPAEQVLSQMGGLEHIYAVSQPGLAVITVQFEVGVDRETALTRLYDVVHSNADWLPVNLGALPPIIKAKGIDSVPILALTLHSNNVGTSAYDLAQVAHLLENELKRVDGTREISTIGAPTRVVEVRLDPARMRAANLSIADLRYALLAANRALPAGELVQDNQRILIETGPLLDNAEAVAEVVVGVHQGQPITLAQVADIQHGPALAEAYAWHWQRGTTGEQPAVTVQISKKAGANAVDVSEKLLASVEQLKGVLIPDDVQLSVTRNYGETANDKANTLIQKLLFATLSVVALVLFALGRREAAIVGVAVILTLTATMFASWAWGFTLNRVSLFALIFSIGILVDDAIVVVENIHRHRQLAPQDSLLNIIPRAVDEVGLMGPYMAPIPINASLGMLLSLAIAFTLTPWLAHRWLAKTAAHHDSGGQWLGNIMRKIYQPLLNAENASRHRRALFWLIGLLIALSMALPMMQAVILKMLPFDNKSELQLIIDMDDDSALEHTAIVLHELGTYLQNVPEVENYQAYAGTSAPINFNGLIRQYDTRQGGNVGDIQVNLKAKSERDDQSHEIAQRLLPDLQAIADRFDARLKLVEVPPGPPVLSPIVTEVYGPDENGRAELAGKVRESFEKAGNLTAIDDSLITSAPRWLLQVDQRKAATLGVSQAEIATAVRAALHGEDVSFVHDGLSKYPTPIRLRVHHETLAEMNELLRLSLTSRYGKQVPLSELVTVQSSTRDAWRYRKDGLPVSYVYADVKGEPDSPLYGMFGVREQVRTLSVGSQQGIDDYFVQQPEQPWSEYALKWDGEWQITYETFRDMGAAYAVGLLLIYLLVVAEFRSYLTPLIIMAPIPLTIIGVMPGHAVLGTPFTATSMIGMIALAGIIVRNSILLVDFIELQRREGVAFNEAIIRSAETRAQPILLTALAAMIGALFILDDPIFSGLAISLIFGVLVASVLTLVVIPLLYYRAYRA